LETGFGDGGFGEALGTEALGTEGAFFQGGFGDGGGFFKVVELQFDIDVMAGNYGRLSTSVPPGVRPPWRLPPGVPLPPTVVGEDSTWY